MITSRHPLYTSVLSLAGAALVVSLAACGGPAPPPTPTPTLPPTPEVRCIPWYEAPDHIGEEVCVEGRILEVRSADTPNPRFAFFIFDPSFDDVIHITYGKFYAWVHSDDWCEYFSDCAEHGPFSTELNGACAHVFGTVERELDRIRTVVTDRAQIEIIDCSACQVPEACASPEARPVGTGEEGTVLIVIAPTGFNDDEYTEVRTVLEASGYAVVVASRSLETAAGDYGFLQIQPDLALADVEVADYDAVVFIGGRGAETYRDDPEAHRVARQAVEEGRVLAAISTGPVILARAGALEGREATVYDPATNCPELEAGGATCTGERIQRDGLVVTARLEQAADEFAGAIIEALQGP